MSKDLEMSCDESVLKISGDETRANYSQSLLALATGLFANIKTGSKIGADHGCSTKPIPIAPGPECAPTIIPRVLLNI